MRVDVKQHKQLRSETTRPPTLFVMFVARLIHVEMILLRQQRQQLFIWSLQYFTDLVDHLGQIAAGNGDVQDVTKIFADRRERCMTRSFEKTNQPRQAWAEQAPCFDPGRQGSRIFLLTMRAPTYVTPMFFDGKLDLRLIDLLDDAGRLQ